MKSSRALLSVLMIAAGFVGGFGYGRWYGPRAAEKPTAVKPDKPARYHCPMHPSYTSDKPGDCPICGMKLTPMTPSPGDGAAESPDVTAATARPPGAIAVSPEKQQLIGVKYEEVQAGSWSRSFRTVGKVAVDETRVAKIQTRLEGWIDKVYVDFTGKSVEKGEPLFTLYSPEMLASQQEFLLALRSRELMKSSPLPASKPQSESLLAAARRRLELWELSEAQIREIARTGQPLTYITVDSPINGYVMTRNAFPKQRITPETELYTLVDLAKVWIMADVFESEAEMVSLGMPVRISLPYSAGRRLHGKVSYIQPQVDPMTRTLKIRIEADNPRLALKPDMFVDVEFQIAMAQRLTVPADAVLDTGLRKTVFVDLGGGNLEPRQVETGERFDGRVEIVRGAKQGERVVVSGNFLIDSESQLKAAAAGMSGHQHGRAPVSPDAPAGGSHEHD